MAKSIVRAVFCYFELMEKAENYKKSGHPSRQYFRTLIKPCSFNIGSELEPSKSLTRLYLPDGHLVVYELVLARNLNTNKLMANASRYYDKRVAVQFLGLQFL